MLKITVKTLLFKVEQLCMVVILFLKSPSEMFMRVVKAYSSAYIYSLPQISVSLLS